MYASNNSLGADINRILSDFFVVQNLLFKPEIGMTVLGCVTDIDQGTKRGSW